MPTEVEATSGGGRDSQGGVDERAEVGRAFRARADGRNGGRGVPAAGDLAGDLLPLPTSLPGGRLTGARASPEAATPLPRPDRGLARGRDPCDAGTPSGARVGSTPSSLVRGSRRPPLRPSTARSGATTWSPRSRRAGARRRSASSGRRRTTSGRSTPPRSSFPPARRCGSSTAWTTMPASCFMPSPAPARAEMRPGAALRALQRSTGFPGSSSPTTT